MPSHRRPSRRRARPGGRGLGAVRRQPLGDIAGREIDRGRVSRTTHVEAGGARASAALAIRDLAGTTVNGVSIDVRAGEIVGVAGLQGSGRDELAGLVFGASRALTGSVSVGGAPLRPLTPRTAVRHGLVLVPAARSRALIATLSARENVALSRVADYWSRLRLQARRERRDVGEWMGRVDVRPRDPEMLVGRFSGGNQQKLVLAKWLRIEPRVLLLDDPTQGVDAGAREGIYDAIAAHAGRGLAILMCSSDAEELARICDRVIVLRDGGVGAEVAGAQLSEETIVRESAR